MIYIFIMLSDVRISSYAWILLKSNYSLHVAPSKTAGFALAILLSLYIKIVL